MAADYIPGADGEFDGWQENWVTYAAANAVALGLDPLVDIPAIQAAQTAWDTDYDGHLTAQAAAQAARQAKDAERATFVALPRSFSQQIQKRTGTTDEQCGGLGITIPDTEPTPVPAPTTAPSLNIVTSERLRHVVEASKTALEGGALGKPTGVRGVQLWRKIGEPAPAVTGVGPRYLEVTPAIGDEAVALLLTSDDEPCISLYVQTPETINGKVIGRLGPAPTFLTPAEWGTVNVSDEAILPDTTYIVQTELVGNALSLPGLATTWLWADANNSGGQVDFDDIICVLDGFADAFAGPCSFFGADIEAGVTNVTIDFDDVLAALDAFSGAEYFDNPAHVDPCP